MLFTQNVVSCMNCMFSAKFAFVEIHHSCTLASVLLQYLYFGYKLYVFECCYEARFHPNYSKTQQIAPGYNIII